MRCSSRRPLGAIRSMLSGSGCSRSLPRLQTRVAMPESADVAIVGYGWAGSLIAAQLVRQGFNVTVLERGEDLMPEPCGHFHGYAEGRRPHARTQNASRETFTLRHGPDD